MYKIVDIVNLTGFDRSALNRYLELFEIREALGGATTHPEYPEESLPSFAHIWDMHKRRETTPKTLSMRLQLGGALPGNDTSSPLASSGGSTAIATQNRPGPSGTIDLFEAMVKRLAELYMPPTVPEDRLINSAVAAELLCCKPRGVGRYVRPVRPGVFRRSDVLRYIQETGK